MGISRIEQKVKELVARGIDSAKTLFSRAKDKGAPEIFLGSFLIKVAAFLGSVILVRLLSKADYGALSYMENIYTYVYLIAGLGLHNAVFRYMVLAKDKEEKKGVLDYVLTRGTLFNLVLVLAVIVVLHFFWTYPLNFDIASTLLPIMMLAVPFQFACNTAQYSMRALFLNRPYAVFAFLTVAMVWMSKIISALAGGLQGVAISYPVVYGALSLTLLAYLFSKNFRGIQSARVLPQCGHKMVGYSIQYMITNGMWALFLQNDLMMLGMLTGDPLLVADYKVAYAIPTILSIVSSSIGIFVSPYFVKNENDIAWVTRNYRRVLLFSLVLIGGGALMVAVLARPMVGFFYGADYLNIIPLMFALLLSAVINNAVRYTAANLLAAMGKVRINMMIAFAGIVCQLILSFILIPRFGAYGCAFTSIIVYSLMAVATNLAFRFQVNERDKSA